MITLNGFPILLEIADGVTHRVAVFAHDKGTIISRVFGIGYDVRYLAIHGSAQVASQMTSLVVYTSRFVNNPPVMKRPIPVVTTYPTGHSIVVGPVTALVSKWPDDNTRMILVAFDHPDAALHESIQPFTLMTQHVVNWVVLNICLVPDVQPVFVTKIIEKRVIGVMWSAHGVDIVPFHHQNISQHCLEGHIFTMFLVMVMSVHPLDINHLSVDE